MSQWQVDQDEANEAKDAGADTSASAGSHDTAPSDAYAPLRDPEIITRPPNGKPLHYQPQWRKDFPIDWPQDGYVARRDFAKFMVLTSLAFAIGQLWIGVQNLWRRHRGVPPLQKIASLASMPIGGTLVFQYPQAHDDCVLIRLASDTLLAYSQKCTHLSCAVIPDAAEGVIRCPCHEGLFDLNTGRAIAGPPRRPLPRVTLRVRGDDVYATGLEWRTS